MKQVLLAFICALAFLPVTNAQEDDLLSLLGEEETTDYANAAFKTNRVINLHSLENTAAGVFDFKISHRFGFISGGVQELFGLDASTIRIGGDYGITNRLMVGFGRSSYEKTYDVFGKYKLLRQSSGKKNMPIIVANSDNLYPVSHNDVSIATGGIAKLVESIINKKFIHFGKPDTQMFNFAFEDINRYSEYNKEEILMVGDTLHTDILGGNKFGINTALVLSGNTSATEMEMDIRSTGIIPDYICESIGG